MLQIKKNLHAGRKVDLSKLINQRLEKKKTVCDTRNYENRTQI